MRSIHSIIRYVLLSMYIPTFPLRIKIPSKGLSLIVMLVFTCATVLVT